MLGHSADALIQFWCLACSVWHICAGGRGRELQSEGGRHLEPQEGGPCPGHPHMGLPDPYPVSHRSMLIFTTCINPAPTSLLQSCQLLLCISLVHAWHFLSHAPLIAEYYSNIMGMPPHFKS